jgi:lysozyme
MTPDQQHHIRNGAICIQRATLVLLRKSANLGAEQKALLRDIAREAARIEEAIKEKYVDFNETLQRQLIFEEGLKFKPYRCTANKLTIGVGRNLEDKGISNDTAMRMLQEDIDECVGDLKTFPWFDELSENRRAALVQMRFVLGAVGLRTFKNTLNHIASGDFPRAAKGLLESKWHSQAGNRVDRLAAMLERDISHDEARKG